MILHSNLLSTTLYQPHFVSTSKVSVLDLQRLTDISRCDFDGVRVDVSVYRPYYNSPLLACFVAWTIRVSLSLVNLDLGSGPDTLQPAAPPRPVLIQRCRPLLESAHATTSSTITIT